MHFWDFFWPRLEREVASDEFLANKLSNQKSSLDFFLNLALVLGVLVGEQLLLLLFWPEATLLWTVVLLLVLSYSMYRVAVSIAEDWCELVTRAFDIHRHKLRQTLGIRRFRSHKDEKIQWMNYCKYAFDRQSTSDLFSESVPDTLTPRVIPSSNVSVTLESTIIDLAKTKKESGDSGSIIKWIDQYIDYTLLISQTVSKEFRQDNSNAANGAYVIVSDPRVPIIEGSDQVPSAKASHSERQYNAQLLAVDEEGKTAQKLLWHVKDLPPI